MAKTIELLLTENVDNLGIVGDVVKVRTGYARNYLLPRAFATTPSEEMIKSLATKRADAEKQIGELRKQREVTISKINGLEVQLIRSCNDMGILYGGVTQQEISKALQAKGFDVRPRDVRIPHAIKRIDSYDVHVKFESDLEAVIKLAVMPDRKLDEERKQEMEFDAEGELMAPREGKRSRGDRGEKGEKSDKEGAPEGGEAKAERADRPSRDRGDRGDRGDRADKKPEKGEKGWHRNASAADMMVEKGWGSAKKSAPAEGAAAPAGDAAGAEKGEKKAKGEKADKAAASAEKPAKAEKGEKKAKKGKE